MQLYHKGWAPLGVYANQPIPYMTFASASQFDVASSALLHDCENRWIVCSSMDESQVQEQRMTLFRN